MSRRQVYRRRRQVVGGGLLLCCALLVLAGFRVAAALTTGPVATAVSMPAAVTAPKARASTPAKSAPEAAPRSIPIRSTGAFARAPGGTDRHGSGTLMTYRVEVETGTGQGAPAFAAAVDATLADPASWTGQGRWSLQRVTTSDVDFVIRLATPATVDKVCATVGLDTGGHESCRAGEFVMINLDRWLQAVPHFRGDVALYRRYVINHEVGHRLGFGHMACPGPGRLAPVMQQQTTGLNGCRANGWPYVAGKLVSGPATS
jgi:hypothetical protein